MGAAALLFVNHALEGLRSPRLHYVTATVTRGTLARTVTATGTVNPILTIIVGTYVSGVINDVRCDFNTKVTKGQLCAKIDPSPYQTIVEQSEAQLKVAKAQLSKDQAALAYSKATFDRTSDLVKRDVATKDSFDQAKANYDQAQAQVALDEAAITQREAELSAAKVNLNYTDIVSPVDGTVVSRNVTIGQTVAASFQTPTLFLIATDLTKLQVDTNVSESDIGGIEEGNLASFTVESFPDSPFKGVVTQVRQAPQTVQNVVTYDAVVSVDNPERKLKPGMTATTKIIVEQHNAVLRIPSKALRYVPSGKAPATPVLSESGSPRPASVYVLRDNVPTRVDVSTGLDDDTNVEISGEGLKEGDQVIVSEQAGGTRGVAQPHF